MDDQLFLLPNIWIKKPQGERNSCWLIEIDDNLS